jgi:hypothetical protein
VLNSCCTLATAFTPAAVESTVFYIRRKRYLLLGHITEPSNPASPVVPSLADRFFIAMLLSDAPMPICDIFVPGCRRFAAVGQVCCG